MSRREQVTRSFARLVGPKLRAAGFTGRRGHLLRRLGPVTQVVEMQHSIYGGRVTANLGLGLEWLKPVVRWLPTPAIGPHAHDCDRWVRIGIVAEGKDRWWSYGEDDESMNQALGTLSVAIAQPGVRWLDAQSGPAAFVEYAGRRLERSRSEHRPEGGWPELRLMAAVSAWSGDARKARRLCSLADKLWDAERKRLVAARTHYRARISIQGRLPGVPKLQDELRQIVERSPRPWDDV